MDWSGGAGLLFVYTSNLLSKNSKYRYWALSNQNSAKFEKYQTQYTQSNAIYHFWDKSYQNWPTCGLKLRFSHFTSKSPSKLKRAPRSQNLAKNAHSKANHGSVGPKGATVIVGLDVEYI